MSGCWNPKFKGSLTHYTYSALVKNIPKEKAASLKKNLNAGMIIEVHGRLAQIGFGKDDCAPVFNISSFRSYPGSASSETPQEAAPETDPKTGLSSSSAEKVGPPQPVYLRGLETPSSAVVKRTYRALPLPVFQGKQSRRVPAENAQDVVMTDGQNGTSTSGGV